MPAPDFSAIARWPDVPACHGWLSLDRRGRWRLQGEPVTHAGLIDFINRQYGCDEAGNWFMQNGPQRVYVALDYTPWVFRLEGDGGLVAHTGEAAGAPQAAFVDEEGRALLQTPLGIGVLDDRDLPGFLEVCRLDDGTPADEEALTAVMAGDSGVFWNGLPLQAIRSAEVPARFGFRPSPSP